MAQNIKGTIDQDGGSSTRPLSTQRRNCRPACRRPFPACSTALCVWLLAVEAAAACSAHVRPRVLLGIEVAAVRSALASLRAVCSPLRQIYNGNG